MSLGPLGGEIMKGRLQHLFAVVAIAAILGACTTTERTFHNDVAALRNSDVGFDGGYLGLQANLLTRRAERIQRAGAAAKPLLVAALTDPERYIAAHVLLTALDHPLIGWPVTEFNHLVVHVRTDGTVVPDGQQSSILRLWSKR